MLPGCACCKLPVSIPCSVCWNSTDPAEACRRNKGPVMSHACASRVFLVMIKGRLIIRTSHSSHQLCEVWVQRAGKTSREPSQSPVSGIGQLYGLTRSSAASHTVG
eukprot:352958-Chlamydomonas_euryale.AAC.11